MTSHDTPNPTPQTPAEIEADLVRQREELAETVQALQNKLDVKSQVQYKAAEFKDRATTDTGKPRPELAAAVGGAVVLVITFVLLKKRRARGH